MDKVAKGMTVAGQKSGAAVTRPRKGDQFRCEECGMQIEVTADCKSDDDQAHFQCCGQEMMRL